MESRYKTLNILSLSEVEAEIDTMLWLFDDLDKVSDGTLDLLNSLIKLAKSLGSTKNY